MPSPGSSNVVLAGRQAETQPEQTPAVFLSAVTRVFGVAPALVRVDLRVDRGEVVLIRGPNGAGKSTLLRVLATAISPTYGSGSILGFDLVRGRVEIRRRVEFVGHRTRLYQDLTGLENLRFTCSMYGMDPDLARGAIQKVGLADVATERVRTYSQGMRQRLALARLTVRHPDLLLFDEPYAGLDSEAKLLVDATIRDAAEEGRTVVMASHDRAAGASATRTMHMDEGHLAGPASAHLSAVGTS